MNADRSRAEIGYTAWADVRVLDAAAKLTPAQWETVRGQFEHMLGTQLWWMQRWTGGSDAEPQVALPTAAEACAAYDASHAALAAFVGALDEAGWLREEPWWKPWGYDHTLPVGEIVTQVAHHGAQHRSEIAMALTEMGASPGDLDFLNFAFASRGVAFDE